MSVMDQQMREIENYRQAVTRMGADILSLRGTVRELEGANSKLRLQLTNYNDATRLIIDSTELDGLPKGELASRYGQRCSCSSTSSVGSGSALYYSAL